MINTSVNAKNSCRKFERGHLYMYNNMSHIIVLCIKDDPEKLFGVQIHSSPQYIGKTNLLPGWEFASECYTEFHGTVTLEN